MSANFGVNVTVVSKAAQPITIDSVTTIAIACECSTLDEGLHFYGSVSAALEATADSTGTAYLTMQLIDFQSVNTPIILSVFTSIEDDDASTKSAVINAIDLLRTAESVTGYRPAIIIAPFYSGDIDVANKIIAIGESLKAVQLVDLDADDESTAVLQVENYSSSRLVLTNPKALVWDTVSNSTVEVPLSPIIAGMIAYVDGESEYGFSDSYSNRAIQGISGLSRPIEFILGETCEADRLRSANISTVIRYDGFRAWGGETCASEEIWRDLARVRVFDKISESAQAGVFFAVDRKADQLYYAKRSVEEFLRNLTGSKVLLGYSVYWDADKNTSATISAGKFYLNIETQNNPIVKSLEMEFAYVDSYGDILMADLI